MRVIDFFDGAASLHPERMFASDVTGERQYTFADGVKYSHEVACGLREAGVRVGDPVGILAPNCPEALLTTFALWRCGAAWVPLNPRNALTATSDFAREVGLKYIVLHSDFSDHAEHLLAAIPTLELIIGIGQRCDGQQFIDDVIARGRGRELDDWNDVHGRRDLVCVLAPTGGTTGRSKPVMITNDIWTTLMNLTSRHFPPTQHPVNLMSAPITHAAGLFAAVMACQGAGTVILRKFDAHDVLDAIEDHGITHMFLPPTALYDLVDLQQQQPRVLDSMRLLWLAAAPISPDRLRHAVNVLGGIIGQSFGQAEAPGFITWMPAEEIEAAAANNDLNRLASCGLPTWGTQVEVMSGEGKLLGRNAIGEIVVRGHLVTPGYFGRPEETEAAHQHNWLHTGDIGRIDSHGYIYIVDRKRDMIISGGFNIYPSEIETVLLKMPSVKQCAVFGAPDERWGEKVVAEIVLHSDSQVKTLDVIDTAKRELGSVKAPKDVVFVEQLPHTANGKIDKRAIRGKYWKTHDRRI
ncbi:hypothetical protein A5638_16710 [Mycolicibacterium fortuitum]|uniref:class I adenylate-forming enzyme family protein n=1 Tax=Mycolicibacterium fortuitum TaxID=1766 RepID=UPI0007ED33CE|nr:AMP-binding protein [Mycolicibacterium fortuitum]OBJ96530.1 hypothetical protein A5638_16710 [Mycolicibacterium fortuitum]